MSGDGTCYVYLMRAGDRTKIGISGNPAKRRKQLQRQSPYAVELFFAQPFSSREAALDCEASAHHNFRKERARGEWFNLDDGDVHNLCWCLQHIAVETATPLSDDDLRALDTKAEHATPGPWKRSPEYDTDDDEPVKILGCATPERIAADDTPCIAVCPTDKGKWSNGSLDARYIAAADPFTTRRLIAEVRRLREEVRRLGGEA